jgi:hypothetical protein
MHIACPKCEWEPDAGARWSCNCGHRWNTFDTGGRCPACGHVWRETQCLACRRFSPHHDWYRDLPPVDFEEIVTHERA